jgi:hypothetical protein
MSKVIEGKGIAKLNDTIHRSNYLIPDIHVNDRTPSWDGFIEVYSNKEIIKKKSDLIARVPVQVKCEMNSDILCEQISHNVKKSDLENYLHDGGVVFFIVRMCDDDNFKIYYETLNTLKLRRYIKSMKNRKSINIIFHTFPRDNIDDMTDILFNFAHDMNKQAIDKCLSLNDFKKEHPKGFDSFAIHYHGVQHIHPIDYFLENEVTVYANHSELDIFIPIDIVKFNEFSQNFDFPILIDNIEYYPSYKLSYTTDGTKIILGNSVSFLYSKDSKKAIFNIKIQGTLSQRIKDTEFVLSLLKNRYYTIGGEKTHNFKFGEVIDGFDFIKVIEDMSNYLDYLSEIKKVLTILKVNEELDFKDITDKDEENINLLVSSILYNEPQSITVNKQLEGISFRNNIKICNIKLALLFIRGKDGRYTLSNFFKDKYTATFQIAGTQREVNASIFLSLKKDDFLTVSNIDYDIIYNSFLKLEPDDDLFNMTIQFVLIMIDVYDVTNKTILLDTSLKILEWVLANSKNETQKICLLDKLQIIKRMRKLDDSEIAELLNLISTSTDNKFLTGAYLLLNNIDMATFHFKKMPESEQIDFNKYPIKIFWGSDIPIT